MIKYLYLFLPIFIYNQNIDMYLSLSILILASLTSIQSGGQTVTQAVQKSHLYSFILIIIY